MKETFLAVADDQNRQPPAQSTKGQANLFGCLVAILLIGALFVSNFGGLQDRVQSLRPLYAAVASSEDENSSQPIAASDEGEWSLLLVNRNNPLPEDYQVETTQLSNGQSVDKRIYPALQAMFDDARADGFYPIVASGYRTAEKQQSLMDEKIASFEAEGYSHAQAQEKAEDWVALPGTSEHQTGLAVDINADGIHSAGYQVYDWLARNAHKYGFIRRYPPDKTDVTGISNEPWHYRYVGVTAAAEMHRQGLCLEEYLSERS